MQGNLLRHWRSALGALTLGAAVLSAPAQARAESVLVVDLAPASAESAGLAPLLTDMLVDELGYAGLESKGLDQVGEISWEVSARAYYESCPEGQALGCQLIVGEEAGAERVVSGTVGWRGDLVEVEVTIVNVETSLLELSYVIELVSGNESALTRSVVSALEELEQREEQGGGPIEEGDPEMEAEIERLRGEEGVDIDIEVVESYRRLTRPRRMTEDDLEAERLASEVAPWERLRITERQYLNYRNSGLGFDEWRERDSGHRLKLLVGISPVGLAIGGTELTFYGAWMRDAAQQRFIARESFQSIDRGTSYSFAGYLGFGILRDLTVEAHFGVTRARIRVKVENGLANEEGTGPSDSYRRVPEYTPTGFNQFFFEAKVRYSILTVRKIRPVVALGVGVRPWPDLAGSVQAAVDAGDTESSYWDLRNYILFPGPVDIGPAWDVGVQFDFSRLLTGYIHVPFFLALNGGRSQIAQEGQVDLLPTPREEPVTPDPVLLVRFELGITFRFGGKLRPLLDAPDFIVEDL